MDNRTASAIVDLSDTSDPAGEELAPFAHGDLEDMYERLALLEDLVMGHLTRRQYLEQVARTWSTVELGELLGQG